MATTWFQSLRPHLGPMHPPEFPADGDAISAVLVTLGWNEITARHEIVLTRRPQSVATHRGQVCFPGGFKETVDESVLATALREMREEVGTRPEDVEVLGTLGTVRTRFGVLIVPWVARITLPYPFAPNPDEVDKLIYLPLERLLEEGLEAVMVSVEGYKVASRGIWVDDDLVWGATGVMLEELRERFLKLPDWKELLRRK